MKLLPLLAGLGHLTSATGLPVLEPIFGQLGEAVATALDEVAALVVGRAGVHQEVSSVIDAERLNGGDDVKELFLEQRLDHFDRLDSRTFAQRYFINKRYWTGASSGAPVFLCVGGEGPPLKPNVLYESVHCNDMMELAPEHNALLVAVEHRYYGKSNPGKDWRTKSLRWLSSQQALADLSSFHGYLTDKEGLSGHEKWVTWGGSYPGMLAGWARLKYPHLFHAAVSSSSPMMAQLDFPEYTEVMRDSLATDEDGVGGSEECASAIESGHAAIGGMLQTPEGRKDLVATFDLCNKSSLEDQSARVMFAGDGVVVLPIQENDPSCNGTVCNIKGVCGIMTDYDRGSEVERLAIIRKLQRNFTTRAGGPSPPPCDPFPDQGAAGGLQRSFKMGTSPTLQMWSRAPGNSSVVDPSNPDRAWLYQTCSEFGFYQTCEVGTRCPFTKGLHTLDLDLRMCKEAFGITPDRVREQVRLTNLYYGGTTPRGSRVIFPNGAIDPWHALGVLKPPMEDLPTIFVPGASHHFWTHPSKPTDSPDVVKARVEIWDQVTSWLKDDD
eukprot:g8184.t1